MVRYLHLTTVKVCLSLPGLLIIPYFIDIAILATNQFYGLGGKAIPIKLTTKMARFHYFLHGN